MRARVVGWIVRCTALFVLFFYFKTSANKLVNLIVGLKVTLRKLVIKVIAWISIPNEPRDFYEKPTISSEGGIAPVQECEGGQLPHNGLEFEYHIKVQTNSTSALRGNVN